MQKSLKIRRLLAPALLAASAALLRSKLLPAASGAAFWEACDRYLSFLGIERDRKTIFGKIMRVSSAPRVENEIFLFGQWEPGLTGYLLSRPRSPGAFVDFGANIGYYTLLGSALYDHVHAVEASPQTAARLRANIARNGVTNATVAEVAVATDAGEITFFHDASHAGGSSAVADGPGRERITVPARRAGDILEEIGLQAIAFIKVDIEGSDHLVLEYLAQQADSLRSGLELSVEFHPEDDAAQGDLLWSAISALHMAGFSLHVVQYPWSRQEYTQRGDASAPPFPVPLRGRPDSFCDLLLRKEPAAHPTSATG